MGVLDVLDPMIRGGATMLFLLWVAILWRDHRDIVSARVAIAMNLAIIAYLLARVFSPDGPARFPYVICDALSVMVPALFWLFARLWFDDQQRIGARSWLLVAAFGALPLIQMALLVTTGTISWQFWVLVRFGMFGFAVAGMWIAWRGRANDLIEARRGFRLGVVGAIGGFILLVTFIEMFHNHDMSHDLGRSVTLAAILITTFIVSVGLYRFARPNCSLRQGCRPRRRCPRPRRRRWPGG